MAIAGIKPEVAKENLWRFLQAARPFMTATDRDGVGFAAMSKTGIWGERWFDPTQAWSKESRKPWTKKDDEIKKKFKGALISDKGYNNFGAEHAYGDTTSAVIYHSRMATCEKTLENVHPFVRENTALIHNGVISNDKDFEKITSTCDSESILNQYHKLDVANNPDGIEKVAQSLQGAYACAVLTIATDGKRYLDLFRNRPFVFAVFVDQLDTVVFCTNDDIIRAACKELGWECGASFKLKDDSLLRFDCDTGEVVHYKSYNFVHQGKYADGYWEREVTGSVGTSKAGESSTTTTSPGHGSGSTEESSPLTPEEKQVLGFEEKKSHLTLLSNSPEKKSEAV